MSERRFHTLGFGLALLACWVLAGGGDIPDADGLRMDRALRRALGQGAFTPWKEWLAFDGDRCVQLKETMLVMQMAGLLWHPGGWDGDFSTARPLVSEKFATELVEKNALSVKIARSWGLLLIQALEEEARKGVQTYDT